MPIEPLSEGIYAISILEGSVKIGGGPSWFYIDLKPLLASPLGACITRSFAIAVVAPDEGSPKRRLLQNNRCVALHQHPLVLVSESKEAKRPPYELSFG